MSKFFLKHINKPTKEQIEKVNNEEWFRAGGECICTVCNKFYNQHKVVEFSEYFHLNELCSGELVKL